MWEREGFFGLVFVVVVGGGWLVGWLVCKTLEDAEIMVRKI